MDAETASVLTFLQAVADAREGMHQLFLWLWGRPGIGKVSSFHAAPARTTLHHWDEEQQRHLVGISLGVSAEMTDGTDIDWSLDISCDRRGWLVECTVYRRDPDEDSSHTEIEFPEWQGVSLEEMTAHLANAVAELRSSVERPGLLLARQQANAAI